MRNLGVIGFAAAALLAGCGGGGGGGGGTSAAPTAVQISQANAKPVGADASGSVQNTSAQGSTGLITGVQVQAGGGAQIPSTLLLAEIVRSIPGGTVGPAMALGVTVPPTTEACPNGGSMTVSGTVASSTALSAGDTLSITASGCGVTVAAQPTTLNGSLSFTVNSGSVARTPVYPFHVVMSLATTNLSVTTGSVTQTSNGDITLDWQATSSTVQTLTASGSTLSNGSTASGVLRTTTWRNYTQSLTMNNALMTGVLTAAVESTNSRLGTGGGSYTVSTPTAVQWDAATGDPTAGVIRVVGASNSTLRITFGAGTATLEVDADGNGSFESVVNSTPAELKSLL